MRRSALYAVMVGLIAVACTPAADKTPADLGATDAPKAGKGRETVTLAGREATVWFPARSSGKAPLILFSHGIGACGTQSDFLMKAFAEAGYLVVAPNHKDARCGLAAAGWFLSKPEKDWDSPTAWSHRTHDDRAEDMRQILAALRRDGRWASRIDFERIGLAGHSLGGYTVLGLAGAWPEWKLQGVDAVLALSPYARPFLTEGNLGGLEVPVMYQGGTKDKDISPYLRQRGGVYDKTPATAYFIELQDAGHLTWTDIPSFQHDNVKYYSLWFMDRYVKGKSSGKLNRKRDWLSDFRAKEVSGK